MAKNLLVAQSGGPSPVINNSLRAVVEAARDHDAVGTVYGGWHGIEGVLKEELLDLSCQDPEEIALLRTTPAAGSIGTCRYKLREENPEDFDRVVKVLKAHDIGHFLYIGGNDSMHTAYKVAETARERGIDCVGVGVPKTIDNDVGDSEFRLIDHTPGYGSVAKYWQHYVQNAMEENRGSSPADPVLVLQAMGRKIGYIPAAARLADPGRAMPLEIALAESGLNIEQIADNVDSRLKEHGHCVVVISEGFPVENLGEVKDSFGHTSFGSSETTVCQQLVNYLNQRGLPVPGKARGNVAGTHQRHDIAYASTTDLDEAYNVGLKAVELAAAGEHGFMATILRNPGASYSVRYDQVPLEKVALSERTFPQEWIADGGRDVGDGFLDYVRPLIGDDMVTLPLIDGRQRLARLEMTFAVRKLGDYVPQALRK